MVNLTIKELDSSKELLRLKDFLLFQPINYPRYPRWVEGICVPELESGWKKAFLAFYDGHLIGNAIYQPHKEVGLIEFKNLRIHPDYRGLYLGRVLVRQVEIAAKGKGIICDTREKQVQEFLEGMNYKPVAIRDLYGGGLDIIMIKEMGPMRFELTTSGLLKPY